jgi:hypothetical protein
MLKSNRNTGKLCRLRFGRRRTRDADILIATMRNDGSEESLVSVQGDARRRPGW